jgi:hypothetical protein
MGPVAPESEVRPAPRTAEAPNRQSSIGRIGLHATLSPANDIVR